MSLQMYKNSSFDLSNSVNNGLNNRSDDDHLNQSLNSSNHSNKKPLSFTNLIRSKFKRKSNQLKSKKKNKEQKSMVRSISIAFTEDAYASQKTNLESISNLYLNDEDKRSTNLLNDKLTNNQTNDEKSETKKNKLQKFSEKIRTKFKFRNNSLDDRSTTDLDDSLEQQDSDVFDKEIQHLNVDKTDDEIDHNMQFIHKLNSDSIHSDLINNDLIATKNKRTKQKVKLRPKSEIFLGDQPFKNSLKNNRFTTIEVSSI